MELKNAIIAGMTLVLMACAGTSLSAMRVDECVAERYKRCPFFETRRTIADHNPITRVPIEGYVRSEGSWRISVAYGPPETCARVKVLLDKGPLDAVRTYERVFTEGGGVISESGSFMHKAGDAESGLKIQFASCRIPDAGPSLDEGRADEPRLDEVPRDERTVEEAGLENPPRDERGLHEPLLDAERERRRLEQERLVRERRRLEQERLAREKRRLEQERLIRERKRLEQERLAREQQRQRRRAGEREERKGSDVLGVVGAILQGVAQGLGGGGGGVARPPRDPDYGSGSGGGSDAGCASLPPNCQRATRTGEARIRSFSGQGMAQSARAQYCIYEIGIEVNRTCAREFRAMGKHGCASQSEQQAQAYQAQLPRIREAFNRSAAGGYSLTCD